MTIEYKDSKRIVALSVDTSYNIVTINHRLSTTDDSAYADLGSALSNTSWVMRYKMVISGLSSTSSNPNNSYLFAISKTTANNQSDQALGLKIQIGGVATNSFKVSGGTSSQSSGEGYNGANFSTSVSNSTFYVESIRNGSSFSVRLTTNSDYTGGEIQTWSTSGTVEDLRYIKYTNRDDNTSSHVLVSTISDIKIYDGVTSVSGTFVRDGTWTTSASNKVTVAVENIKPSNVQDNSLLVEKDTARRYWFSAESARTPTFEDDFSSDNWTDVGTQIGVSGGKMAWNALRNGSDQGSYYDIGTANISETEWILDFTLDIDAMTEGSANAYFTIGLSDTATMNVNTSQDHIGLLTYMDTSSGGNSRFMAQGVNGGVLTGGTDFTTADPQTLGLYYLRIRRTSATECKVAIYSDSDYTTLVEEETVTITSGLSGLRYLKLTNLTVSGAGTGVFNGTMDNVKFYNAVTSTTTPATWTMQPTYQTDFSSSTGWTFKDSAKASISGGSLSFDFEDNSGDDDSCYYDLGSTMSDTKWLLRFKINWTTFDDNSRCWFGLASNTTAQNVAKDFIGLLTHKFSGTANWESMDKSNASLDFAGENSSSTTISTSTDYWVQIRRLTDTTYDIKVYDDSAYTSLVDTVTGTMSASSISGLQYIMFYNRNDHETTYNQVGTIDDLSFYNGVTSIN